MMQNAHAFFSKSYRRFVERKRPIRSILRKQNPGDKRKRPGKDLRFRDLCKTSYPALAFFAEESRLIRLWRSVIFWALVYESWAFPFRLAFNSPSDRSNIFFLDITVDILIVFDTGIQACSSLDYALKQVDDPTSENEIISRILKIYSTRKLPVHISCHFIYLLSSILLSSEAFDQFGIDLTLTSSHWIWWACTIPRMTVRGRRLILRFIESVNDMTSKIHIQAAKIIGLSAILSAHWIGCLYFFMSRLRGLDRRTWVSSIEDTLVVYERFTSPIYFQYLLAVFKGFSSISGTEFTAYLANNPEEQVVGLLMIIVQVYTSALILGTIIHFFALKDPRAQQAAERQRDLQQFVHLHQIPAELETKLTQGLAFQLRKMALDNVDAEFDLSRSLEIKVAKAKYSDLIQRCSAKGRLFQDCSERFLDEMLVLCSTKYFMASEEILEKGDISRELIFLIDGAVEAAVDGTASAAEVISSDVPDHCPCVGEIAFFLGIMQPWSVRAHKRDDVRVAALTREDSETLFKRFPDQRELICRNILRSFDLEPDGSLISAGGDDDADRELHRVKVRSELHSAIVRRREESFASLVFAAKQGDLDVVRMMLAGGMELHRDYDGRTVLAHAATAGVYKVCDVLLEEKADINALNRWGQTPLDEAVAANQGSIIQLLSQRHARLGSGNMATALIEAAANGKAEALARILRENQIGVEARDYDGRTPLHLACANGHMKVVELLLGCKAPVNAQDRWGGTPLEDAISSGHSSIAYLLWGRGGQMQQEAGVTKLVEAAGRGNMVALRMLRTCRVVDLDCKDYDGRTALAVAASEGRVLATSYLLSCSCSPDELDGWGASALDRALTGGTLYHMYCAKLIQSWGGQISALRGTKAGEQALQELDQIKIGDVRQKLKWLIAQGHDQTVPKAMSEYEIRFSFESCMSLIPLAEKVRLDLEDPSQRCDAAVKVLRESGSRLKSLALPVCELLDLNPFLQKRKRSREDGHSNQTRKLSASLNQLCEPNPVDHAVLPAHERRKHTFLVQKLKKTISRAMEDGTIDEDEEVHIREAWDALAAADQEMLFEDVDELDSDEEAQLHEDVDVMMAEREYCEDHGLDRTLYQVSRFQSTALRIGEMEDMYNSLCSLFWDLRAGNEAGQSSGMCETQEPCLSIEDLSNFFIELSKHTSLETPHYEVDEMFEEARAWTKEIQFEMPLDRRSSLTHFLPGSDEKQKLLGKLSFGDRKYLPLRSVVAGSAMFRHALLTAPIDEIWCLLENKTNVLEFIPETVLQELVVNASIVHVFKGQILFQGDILSNSRDIQKGELLSESKEKPSWFIVISGTLSLTAKLGVEGLSTDVEGSDDIVCPVLCAGQWFGAYSFLGGVLSVACSIQARSACTLIQLTLDQLDQVRTKHPQIVVALRERMAESSWTGKSAEGSLMKPHLSLRSLDRSANTLGNDSGLSSRLQRSTTVKDRSFQGDAVQAPFAYSSPSLPLHISSPSLHSKDNGICVPSITGRVKSAHNLASTFALSEFSTRRTTKVQYSAYQQAKETTESPIQKRMSQFYVVQCGLKYIEDAWQFLSGGNDHVGKQVLVSMLAEVGEIGSGTFKKLFLSNGEDGKNAEYYEAILHDLYQNEFWGLWIALLADKRLKEGERKTTKIVLPHNGASIQRSSSEFEDLGDHNHDNGYCDPKNDEYHQIDDSAMVGCLEELYSRFAKSRQLSKVFLSSDLIDSGRYEQVYVMVVGDLNSPMQYDDIPKFIRLLIPEYKYNVSKYNCNEFIKTFGKISQSSVSWPDIRKVLRTKCSEDLRQTFINGMIHPQSRLSSTIHLLGILLAVYHFFSIPWRLCFADPSELMLDTFSLCLFVPTDILTVLYVLARLNTAHQSVQRNYWVTNRWKVYRKLGNICVLAAFPIDWIIYSVGGTYPECLWFRALKLLFCYHVVSLKVAAPWPKPLTLVLQSIAVMHLCCCFWYYIGVQYKYWDENHPYSWFKLGFPLDDPRYFPDSEEVGTGYSYHGLECSEVKTATCNQNENWYYYGMWYSDSKAAQYLLSFWIVCSRVSNQGLIGNIVPQNFAEVIYSILLVMMNLTVFRYVIGEMSASVMNFNEHLVSARDRAEKVLNFIKTNRLPEDLVNEIKMYCNTSSSASVSMSKYARVLRFLPHPLQVEVARHICGNLLDNVCLFRGCSDHFKDFLIVSMSTTTYSPDEYIFRLGEVATDMYIVQSGTAEELIEDLGTLTGEKPFATARQGQALGALALFFELRHMYSARVSRTSGATCLRLNRERFLQLLKYCPEEEERITENAMQSFQKKFGLGGTTGQTSSRAGSTHSARNELDSEKDTVATASSAAGPASSGLDEVGKQARHSISQIKSRRRALRTHVLLSAARSNNLARTEWALQGGHIDVNAFDDMGRSALHVAASEGHLEMVELLLDENADPHLQDKHGNSPLNDAVRQHHDAVAALIRRHAPNVRVVLHGLSAGIQMCSAAASGDIMEVERLVTNRVSAQAVDYDSRTALHLAASEGRVEVARFLIVSKADVQAKDRLGNSPLDDAIRHGHHQVQAALRAAGARVGWMRNGLKACRASAKGDEDSVRLVRSLVEMGLDPAACDQYDRTPLHLAASSGGLALLEFLLGLKDSRKSESETKWSVSSLSAGNQKQFAAFLSKFESTISVSENCTQGNRSAQLGGGGGEKPYNADKECNAEAFLSVNDGQDDAQTTMKEPEKFLDTADLKIRSRHANVGFINALDRHNGTPLDDAVRRGNVVAALALERAGGLRSSDESMVEHLARAREARIGWWRDARKKTVAEAIERSPEIEVLQSVEARSLPLLLSFLSRIEDRQRDLEENLSASLKVLHCVLEQVTMPYALQLSKKGSRSITCCKWDSSTALNKNDQASCNIDANEDEGASAMQDDEQQLSAIEMSITNALDGIACFFSRDMEEAQEATAIESLTRGRFLQPSCLGLARSIQGLRTQLRYMCKIMRLLRRIFRNVSTFRLAAAMRKYSLTAPSVNDSQRSLVMPMGNHDEFDKEND